MSFRAIVAEKDADGKVSAAMREIGPEVES